MEHLVSNGFIESPNLHRGRETNRQIVTHSIRGAIGRALETYDRAQAAKPLAS